MSSFNWLVSAMIHLTYHFSFMCYLVHNSIPAINLTEVLKNVNPFLGSFKCSDRRQKWYNVIMTPVGRLFNYIWHHLYLLKVIQQHLWILAALLQATYRYFPPLLKTSDLFWAFIKVWHDFVSSACFHIRKGNPWLILAKWHSMKNELLHF